MADLFDAMRSLRKGCDYTTTDGILVWNDTNREAPTQEEIDAEIIKLTEELPMKILRHERNILLKRSDVYGLADYPEGETKQKWRTYRQELRDLPQTQTPTLNDKNELLNVTFPTPPS
ncbi:MAG: hypothetical protein CMD14_09215 [Flavobacteriales bacterium]|nr:hypothetical protein [Flavobacteriales bacterium]|tara:strand:+ start:31118 stop:31471 length:354 start_codon:yes stop_codon:yes gene_type:complete